MKLPHHSTCHSDGLAGAGVRPGGWVLGHADDDLRGSRATDTNTDVVSVSAGPVDGHGVGAGWRTFRRTREPVRNTHCDLIHP